MKITGALLGEHAVGMPFRMDKGIQDVPVVTMDWNYNARFF
jgi:hypothetical protein